MRLILYQSLAVAERILRGLLRTRRSLFFWFLFPILMLVLFGLIYGGENDRASSFEATYPGILIGAAYFFSCLGGPTLVLVAERERRTLKRLLTSPMGGIAYFLGVYLAFLAVAAAQLAIVLGLAFLFGAGYHGSILLGLTVVFLTVTTYLGFGFVFGSKLAKRTEDANGPLAAIGVPLLVLGGTFFDTSQMPAYMQSAARLNPIYHMITPARKIADVGWGWADVEGHLLALTAFAILAVVLGIRSYSTMLQAERRS